MVFVVVCFVFFVVVSLMPFSFFVSIGFSGQDYRVSCVLFEGLFGILLVCVRSGVFLNNGL